MIPSVKYEPSSFKAESLADETIGKCILLREDYWVNIVKYIDHDAIKLSYPMFEEKILKKITKAINKGITIPNNLLDMIEKKSFYFDDYYKMREKTNSITQDDSDIKSEMQKYKSEGQYPIIFFHAVGSDLSMFLFVFDKRQNKEELWIKEFRTRDPIMYNYIANLHFNLNSDDLTKLGTWKVLNTKVCIVCKVSHANKKCSSCCAAYYCKRECQVIDWSTHKLLCPNLKQLKTEMANDDLL